MTDISRYLDSNDRSLYIGGVVFQPGARPIAAGASDVFRAQLRTHRGATENVAVKRLRYTQGHDSKNEATDHTLEKEITALKGVHHDHVLPFIGLVRHNGDPCIVTPWISGGNLRQYLTTRPNADRAKILRQVASALQYLHAGGRLPGVTEIIHGDIHAGNVLIGDNGKALLCDFGLCKVVPIERVASLSPRVNGTPDGVIAYLAPEFHMQRGVLRSTKTDVFAFGMLIFETYTGAMPFRGYTNHAIATAVIGNQRPARAEIARADFSDVMWEVACRCWAGKPQDRPTMAMVFSELGKVTPV